MTTSYEMTAMASSGSEKRGSSLEHPLHGKHALTLREFSKDCQVPCSFCSQPLQGQVYCCEEEEEECDFLLHEACARIEFPPHLHDHPNHPDHHRTLNLVCENNRYTYCCPDCCYSLDALTALATRAPPADVEEDTIQYFRHEEHPLSSFRVDTVLEVRCKLCEQEIFGEAYGCRACLYLLHESCARLAREIQHPLHQQHPLKFLEVNHFDVVECAVCSDFIGMESVYGCREGCGFGLHVVCGVATVLSGGCSIRHHSHRHKLSVLHVGERVQTSLPVECSICRLHIWGGGEVFACAGCSFFVHKFCTERLPKEIQHYLHPQHPRLVLQTEDPHGGAKLVFKCDSCSGSFFDLAFGCEDCEFHLDPSCALQMLSAVKDGGRSSILHPAHEHSLLLVFQKPGSVCFACKLSIEGLAYFCLTCKSFWLHKSCGEMPMELEHALHPQHPVVLSEAPPEYYFCDACHEKFEGSEYDDDYDKKHVGLAYYCAKCEFYMDLGCASLNKTTLKHPRHEHPLTYCPKYGPAKQLRCNRCGKRCRYDFYCCIRCNFSLHHECLPLPPSIEHECHTWHPLQLYDMFVDGNPDDLYCDFCETRRHPNHGVYRCEECNFTAHIDCMISDDRKEESKGITTFGSDRPNQVKIEIASLKAKIEIMQRDLEAMEGNLKVSVQLLEEINSEGK